MHRIIGFKDNQCQVLEDNLISEGIARAVYARNVSEYLTEYTRVEIDNSATKHIGL